MDDVKKMFDFCIAILKIRLDVCGYNISLFEVLCFCVVAFLLLCFFYGSMK